jgi:hypothetical protein
MKKNSLFLCFLLVFSLVQAQTDDLSGVVRDSIGNKPLAGVSVFLNSTSKGTVTHADGSFLLKGFPKGKYELVVSAPAMVMIRENGSYFPPQEILVSGYWARSEKISNLLPLNYALP